MDADLEIALERSGYFEDRSQEPPWTEADDMAVQDDQDAYNGMYGPDGYQCRYGREHPDG